MKKKIIPLAILCAVSPLIFISCEDDAVSPPTIVKEWTVPLSTQYENPARAGRTESGTATIQLLSDNSIKYTIAVTGLAAGDALTAAHIHTGDVITNGPVVLGFDPVFSGSNATGTIAGIRASFVDSLKNSANELYFNVHSTQQPGGLVRGQMNVGIELAADVALSGANEVPNPVVTSATGTGSVRLTADKKLYSKVTVINLEAADALTAAHIHNAAAGANAGVLIGLASGAADFGVVKMVTVSDAVFATLKTDPIYLNAHSVLHPAGLIRGQIR
jgi:hypothetical protein